MAYRAQGNRTTVGFVRALAETVNIYVTSDTINIEMRWSAVPKITDVITPLHWCLGGQLIGGGICFRSLFFPHLVYSSVGRDSLFSVESFRC